MVFLELELDLNGKIEAKAIGHADEVVSAFYSVAQALLSSQGPWRITGVSGICPFDIELDSDMRWILTAETKKGFPRAARCHN